jgi:hypothetical protein
LHERASLPVSFILGLKILRDIFCEGNKYDIKYFEFYIYALKFLGMDSALCLRVSAFNFKSYCLPHTYYYLLFSSI